ncbi:MAG: hypothetical protein Q8K31_07070 [Burkholderiaceae bacterium]|nr:hypothetical protein [Burkholderiaceae bacterium]
MKPIARRSLLLLSCALAGAFAPVLQAQTWPSAPIRIVVAYPAGGVSDNVPTGGSATEFARQIAAESQNNLRVIRSAGIKAE